jgi:hypothetical protein
MVDMLWKMAKDKKEQTALASLNVLCWMYENDNLIKKKSEMTEAKVKETAGFLELSQSKGVQFLAKDVQLAYSK